MPVIYTPDQLAHLDPVAISGASPRHIQSVLEQLIATAQRERQERAVAWEVCASMHRDYCKKVDPFYTTRQADFTRHAAEARGIA